MKYETFDAEIHLTSGEIITMIDANDGLSKDSKTTRLSHWADRLNILCGMSGVMWSKDEVLILYKDDTDLGCDIIINVNQISYIKKINEREVDDGCGY